MDAIVKEVLRMRPPLPIGAARHVLEPFQIGPWTITPEVAVLVDTQGLHHDPALYPQPQQFRPERFLDETPEPYAFLPFGGGVHRCLGAALAQARDEGRAAGVLMRFEPAPLSSRLAATVPRGPTFAPRGGGRVRIVRERERVPAALAAS